MKRSHVVNLIANYFYESNVEPEDADKLGEELLAELEQLGMLPPVASEEFHQKWCEEMGYENRRDYQLNTGDDIQFNQWEPEDGL